MTRFDIFFDRVIGHEGGYVNNPKDPGGETKWGIAKRAYPRLNIATLTREDAKAIYLRDYYEAYGIDNLPNPVAFQVFDAKINHTPARSSEWLASAQSRFKDPVRQALYFHRQRSDYYTDLPTWNTFGKGWARRQADNLFFLLEDME